MFDIYPKKVRDNTKMMYEYRYLDLYLGFSKSGVFRCFPLYRPPPTVPRLALYKNIIQSHQPITAQCVRTRYFCVG